MTSELNALERKQEVQKIAKAQDQHRRTDVPAYPPNLSATRQTQESDPLRYLTSDDVPYADEDQGPVLDARIKSLSVALEKEHLTSPE